MDLQILISKKGTKVVTATNLHLALQLPNHHYGTNVKKWLSDVYEFKDGIRKPMKMRDYAKRKVDGAKILDDFYFSIELAKLITLTSKSKFKQKYAKRLLSLEDKVENAELLSIEQVTNVLELAKVMGLVSCQMSSEQQHLQQYEDANGGGQNWWKYRAKLLGYSADFLKKKMQSLGQTCKGKTQRQMLMKVDKYEMVRSAVIDLFKALGKSDQYAKNLGDLAKVFAKELKVDVWDDRNASCDYTNNMNQQLIGAINGFQEDQLTQQWH